jgi:hypothetical protein
MAFKMKHPTFNYKSKDFKLKVQKDYAGQADGRATSSPFQQRVQKEGEGQDQDKIFDNKGNHVGDWKDGKKVMKKKLMESASEMVQAAATGMATGGKMKRTITKNLKKK